MELSPSPMVFPPSSPGFLHHAGLLTFGVRSFPQLCRAVLHLVGYLAASLAFYSLCASTFPNPHPPYDNPKCVQALPKVSLRNRIASSSTENHCSYLSALMAGFNGSRGLARPQAGRLPSAPGLPLPPWPSFLYFTSGQNPRGPTSLSSPAGLLASLNLLAHFSMSVCCLLTHCPTVLAQAPSVFCPLVFLVSSGLPDSFLS